MFLRDSWSQIRRGWGFFLEGCFAGFLSEDSLQDSVEGFFLGFFLGFFSRIFSQDFLPGFSSGIFSGIFEAFQGILFKFLALDSFRILSMDSFQDSFPRFFHGILS